MKITYDLEEAARSFIMEINNIKCGKMYDFCRINSLRKKHILNERGPGGYPCDTCGGPAGKPFLYKEYVGLMSYDNYPLEINNCTFRPHFTLYSCFNCIIRGKVPSFDDSSIKEEFKKWEFYINKAYRDATFNIDGAFGGGETQYEIVTIPWILFRNELIQGLKSDEAAAVLEGLLVSELE